jgi:hypothetical protein
MMMMLVVVVVVMVLVVVFSLHVVVDLCLHVDVKYSCFLHADGMKGVWVGSLELPQKQY